MRLYLVILFFFVQCGLALCQTNFEDPLYDYSIQNLVLNNHVRSVKQKIYTYHDGIKDTTYDEMLGVVIAPEDPDSGKFIWTETLAVRYTRTGQVSDVRYRTKKKDHFHIRVFFWRNRPVNVMYGIRKTIDFSYDSLGRPVARNQYYPGHRQRDESYKYTYDSSGRLAELSKRIGSFSPYIRTYKYDSEGKLAGYTGKIAGKEVQSAAFIHDSLSRLTEEYYENTNYRDSFSVIHRTKYSADGSGGITYETCYNGVLYSIYTNYYENGILVSWQQEIPFRNKGIVENITCGNRRKEIDLGRSGRMIKWKTKYY